ncbi:MAG: serine/threonine protein kinase [Bryobacterales bacterium]|nr:serine/threonine protein kinase [Bryobacterales bacterium]
MQELFHAASELPAPHRAAYLDQWCPDDPELRLQVEDLLASDEQEDLVRKSVQQAAGHILEDRDSAGERIGPFRILHKLASGGMGSVFLAERDDDQYRQQVAIKLIRYGLNREDILRRFRAERQILANLTHANIARLLDGGVTSEGLPYLVMEFVDGASIDAYCAQKHLTVRGRLSLFLTVCEAVQSAHASLVVHRDIKPANILVTSDGHVKLLDFGIAKILHQGAHADEPALTRATDRVMTPEYASPEQVRGEPVTTATDVYALGVLLYELLTGRRPFRLENTSAAEAERIICESEPDKPSTAAGKASGTEGHTLSKQLSGDLDNIVRMAMRKEASRRYPSAGALAEDIRRYLDGFPVVAAPDSWSYRADKFSRRHKAAVAMAALVALLIIAFGIGMAVLASRAQRERDTAQQVSQFMMDLFSVADPERARGREITAREVLDRSAAKLKALDNQPAIQARLLDHMGKIYENIGLFDQSASLLAQAVDLRRKLPGKDDPALAASLKALAELRRRKTDYASAEKLARESLAIRTRLHGERHFNVAESLNTLALTLDESGRPKDAEVYFRRLLAMRDILRVNDPNQHLETAVLSNLGGSLRAQNRFDEAEKYLRECLLIRRQTLKGDHPRLALILAKLGGVLTDAARYTEAEPLLREALAMRRRVYSGNHPDITGSLSSLAHALAGLGQFDEAERLYREALDMGRKLFGPQHRNVGVELRNLAGMLRRTGRNTEAEALLRESLRIARQLPAGHPHTATALLQLGALLNDTARSKEAEPLLREAAQIRRKHFPESSWMVAVADAEIAGALIRSGRDAQGAPLLEDSLNRMRSSRGPDAVETRNAARFLPRKE